MNDWFSLKNSLKRGAKKLASQEIRIRKHITPTIFPDLIYILHVVPWLFFQEYLCTYIKNSPILDFLIKCKPTIKWILNVFGVPVYNVAFYWDFVTKTIYLGEILFGKRVLTFICLCFHKKFIKAFITWW